MGCRRDVFLAVAEQYQAAVEKDSKKYGECLARLRVRHVTFSNKSLYIFTINA